MMPRTEADWMLGAFGVVILGLAIAIVGYEIDAVRVQVLGVVVATGGLISAWMVWMAAS